MFFNDKYKNHSIAVIDEDCVSFNVFISEEADKMANLMTEVISARCFYEYGMGVEELD